MGLRPELRLTDTEPVRRTLDHLVRGETLPDDAETRAVLDTLAPVLVEGAGLLTPDVAPGDVAAAAAADPSGYRSRLEARRHALVAVRGAVPGVGLIARRIGGGRGCTAGRRTEAGCSMRARAG